MSVSGPLDATMIAVVGLGAVGGSACVGFKAAGYITVGYDIDRDRVEEAVRRGVIDLGASSLTQLASFHPDVVFVCVPPDRVVSTAGFLLDRGLLVSDVCSVKSPIVALLGGHRGFLGGHPLAGSERSGLGAIRDNMFTGANWILTPCRATAPDTITTVVHAVKAVGAQPTIMDAARHDEALAYTSHLVHVVAAALASSVGGANIEMGGVAGPGFGDTTRVANGPTELWVEILLANRKNVLLAVAAMLGRTAEFAEALRAGDARALAAFLDDGSAARRRVITASATAVGTAPDRVPVPSWMPAGPRTPVADAAFTNRD